MKEEERVSIEHILSWKQKIESVSGLKCIYLEQVLKEEEFTFSQVQEAKENDRIYFKGLIADIEDLL